MLTILTFCWPSILVYLSQSTCARNMYRHEIKLIVKQILCIKLVKYWDKCADCVRVRSGLGSRQTGTCFCLTNSLTSSVSHGMRQQFYCPLIFVTDAVFRHSGSAVSLTVSVVRASSFIASFLRTSSAVRQESPKKRFWEISVEKALTP